MQSRPEPTHQLNGPSGPVAVHVTTPTGVGPWPGVVVLHDAVGVTNDLVRQCRWLSDAGFVAAAPDLFGGRTVARCLRRMVRDYAAWEGETFLQVEAVRSWLAARDDGTGRVGVIGFCLGGGLALSLAPGHGFGVSGVNYGQLPKDAEHYLVGACPVVGSYGGRDRSLPDGADRLRRALDVAGVENDVREYPAAGHGFLNDHREGEVPVLFRVLGLAIHDGFHGPSAEDARRRIVDFFHRHLGAPGDSPTELQPSQP